MVEAATGKVSLQVRDDHAVKIVEFLAMVLDPVVDVARLGFIVDVSRHNEGVAIRSSTTRKFALAVIFFRWKIHSNVAFQRTCT